MTQLFQKLKSLLQFRRMNRPDESPINRILQKRFLQLRNADPETDRQWLRVQHAITEGQAKAATIKSRPIPRFALAAAMVTVALMGTFAYLTLLRPSYETFATRKGEQKQIVLDDGSEVTLSYTTELLVPELRPSKPRRMSLTGEAFFRVRQNDTPFIVSTQYADIEVVGTEFNLRAREDGLEVAVIEGIVRVRAVKNGKDSTLLLTQHHMAICPHDDFPRRVGTIPSPEYPGWMHGKLFLNKTSFLTASREIEMRFDITILIEDRNVRSGIITGILDAKTPESAITALCELVGKRYTHDGQSYTIY